MDVDFDRLKKALATIVKAVLPTIDALALYPSTVTAQNADGTLDLDPDDARLDGQQNVPIAYGIPGVKVKVAAGARVLLGFAAGDPSQPRATLWDSASVTELDISASSIKINGGTQGAARHGDTVEVTIPAGALTLAVSGSSATGPAAPLQVNGQITQGSSTTEIG